MEEDFTKCGEFVCSYFAWVPLDEQRKNADKLCKITNKNEKITKKIQIAIDFRAK